VAKGYRWGTQVQDNQNGAYGPEGKREKIREKKPPPEREVHGMEEKARGPEKQQNPRDFIAPA